MESMKLREILLPCTLLLSAVQAIAQSPGIQWRQFDLTDGLAETACESVTLGGSGNVLVRHPNTNAISVFDGYEVTIVPGLPNGHRVFESPGGQLWTVTAGGLAEFRDGAWHKHLVPEIERQQQTSEIELPLLPVRQGLVLVLLSDQLLAFSSETTGGSRTEIIRRAEETGLETFLQMTPSSEGGLWITGAGGCAHLSGPLRNVSRASQWREFAELTDELLEPVQRLANVSADLNAQVADSIVGRDGALWFATATGLVRCSESLWRPVNDPLNLGVSAEVPQLAEALNAVDPQIDADIAQHSWQAGLVLRKDIWLGGQNQIAWRHNGTWRLFGSTNGIGPENVLAFASSPDGRVFCATPNKVWEFNGRTWLALQIGLDRVTAMRCSRDGILWVATHGRLYRCVRGNWFFNTEEDGLPEAVVTDIHEDQSGEIFAITTAGVCVFRPDADTDAPRTFIEPLSDRRHEFREGDAVRLSFDGRDKWNVTTPGRLLFSYRLDDREWSPFGDQTEVVFVNLMVGRHYFQVRAMDRNGNIDPQPARLEFAVALPWYRETRLVVILTLALVVAVLFAALAFNRHHKLQLSYAGVERQIAERTRELDLANRELLQSQKMNALGTLAAGIAHDFNNILSIIKGSAQIIEENPGNLEKIRTRADRIKTVVEQGSDIVNAMLGFSGSAGEQAGPCDLNSIVADSIKLLGDRFLHEVTVTFEPASGLPETVSVRNFIQQILLNLIFNAAEAMSGQKSVVLSTREFTVLPQGMPLAPREAHRYVAVSVRDTGGGISPEILPRIFEPFFTTKALSTKRGTGLGLSMSYELAKKLDGGLAVESTVGKGSKFTLFLPVKEGVE